MHHQSQSRRKIRKERTQGRNVEPEHMRIVLLRVNRRGNRKPCLKGHGTWERDLRFQVLTVNSSDKPAMGFGTQKNRERDHSEIATCFALLLSQSWTGRRRKNIWA